MNKHRVLLLQNIVYALFLLAACGQATNEFKVIQQTETPNDDTIIAPTKDVLLTTATPHSTKNVNVLEKCVDTASLSPLASVTAKGVIVEAISKIVNLGSNLNWERANGSYR